VNGCLTRQGDGFVGCLDFWLFLNEIILSLPESTQTNSNCKNIFNNNKIDGMYFHVKTSFSGVGSYHFLIVAQDDRKQNDKCVGVNL